MDIKLKARALLASVGMNMNAKLSSYAAPPMLGKPDDFIAGPAPRGGWPIKPYSVSKYTPHQRSKEKARRQRHMGIFEFQEAA
tara:strand:- start:362 stop:610 length:249 start_codon:yes stop_codon:yes gene_type:complete